MNMATGSFGSAGSLGRMRTATPSAEVVSTGGPPRVPVTYHSLNVVRVVLGLAVLLYHLGATLALDRYFGVDLYETVFGFGGARVPFFFVLSGFLLTLVYGPDVGRASKAPAFLWRRFIRIYPTYWIILVAVMGVALLSPSLESVVPDDPWVLLKTFLLIPQHPSVGGPTGAPVIIAAWTLHYELVVYLVLALWIWSRTVGAVVTAGLVFNAAACAQSECGFYAGYLASSGFMYFVFGAAAAWVVRRLPSLPGATFVLWLACAAYLLVAVLTHGDYRPGDLQDPSVYYGMLASVILICLTKREMRRPPRPGPRWLKLMSDSSYAMYLLHFPLISLMCKVLKHLGLQGVAGATIALVVTLVVCVGASLLFHVVVERRVLALRT
jgi:exopolysaccharide production protein ExoZ